MPRATEACEEAQGIFQQGDDHLNTGRVLLSRGWVAMDASRHGEARTYYRESLRLARMVGDEEGAAAALDMLGLLLLELNDHEAAEACLQRALGMSQAIGDHTGLGYVLGHLGVLKLRQRDPGRSTAYLDESLSLAREIGDQHLMAMALMHRAELHHRAGELSTANDLLLEMLTINRQTGYIHGVALALRQRGGLAIERGLLDEALGYLQESVEAFQRVGLRYGLQLCGSLAFDGLACLALKAGDRGQAVRFLGMADALLGRNGLARPEGEPLFLEQRWLDTIRGALSESTLHAAWRDAQVLSEDAMVERALSFTLPASIPRPTAPMAPSGGEHGLTPRELDVLRLMAEGLTNQQIADALFVSQRTVASHVASILGKLGLGSRTGAVAHAIRTGLA